MKVRIEEKIYRTVGDIELITRIFYPPDWSSEDQRATIIFFFGGGWRRGSIDQFRPQSEYLAAKGMVAITPEYRVESKHGTTPFDCLEDAKEAILWVRRNYKQLGIDPNRIAVGGGSAGGHLAACAALLDNGILDDQGISWQPNLLVLFNPVIDTSAKGYGFERLGERYMEISPIHNIKTGVAPTIIFHGTNDKIVAVENVVEFCAKMNDYGNTCSLITYAGRNHGFFNLGRSHNDRDYYDTLKRMEAFLEQYGYLDYNK